MLNEEVKQQAKKKKKYNTINKRQREVLRCYPQGESSFVQHSHESTLHIFECTQIVYILQYNLKFCYSFFMFQCVLFSDHPSYIFHDFIFYDKIALESIS